MAPRYVLWDFGDTMADQDWMLQAPPDFPDWPRAWIEIARGELEQAWYLNECTSEDIAEGVANLLGMHMIEAMAHIRTCCSRVRFFDVTWKAAQSCSLPQAIVTVNPDVFTRYVVPRYRLDELFPVIVTSWEERTVDKAELCARAVQRLGADLDHSDVLLIDNSEAAIRAWEAVGGQGHVFRDEASFAAEIGSVLGGPGGLRHR